MRASMDSSVEGWVLPGWLWREQMDETLLELSRMLELGLELGRSEGASSPRAGGVFDEESSMSSHSAKNRSVALVYGKSL
jgi:hypothetical protein